MNHKLLIGDVRGRIKELADESVQLVVTSPPYFSIKDYGHPDQIGLGGSYLDYLRDLELVWMECVRALEPGCKIAINIGDQFLRATKDTPYQVLPIHSDTIQCLGQETIHLGSIIWRKITTTKTSGGGSWMGSIYYPRDGYVTFEHEYILLFKKPGKAQRPNPESKELSRLTKEQRSEWFRGIWNIPPVRQEGHVAMFPVELPERLIRMFTFHGETVLDPFVGSGTTMEAAEKSGRHSIGIDLIPESEDLCRKRVPHLVKY